MGRLASFLIIMTWTAVAVCAEQPTRAAKLIEQLYDATDPRVIVAAHRGDWRNAPENSLKAIENAIAMGVDIVEVDIRMTQDGHFVLMHDKTLDRTTTGQGEVSLCTLDELRSLRLKNGYGMPTSHTIPTLADALQCARGKALVYLDKSEGLISQAYAVAKKLGVQDQVLFYGHKSSGELRAQIGDLSDRIHYLPKLDEKTQEPADYIGGHSSRAAFVTSFSRDNSGVLNHFPRIRSSGARVWVSPLWPEICAGFTDDVAVDDPDAAWGRLIDRGATIICTDRPREILVYLRGKKLHD